MAASNKVIAGDYQGAKIRISKTRMFIGDIVISKDTVDHYEIMNENVNTTSFTKGNTKKSIVGAGTKGAVGAVVGNVIAPGIGTLIGGGAGLATSKGKTKSVTKEVTTKEIMLAVYFKSGQQSLVEIDDDGYKQFLKSVFAEAPQPKVKVQKDPARQAQQNKTLKILGWVFIPFVMIFIDWKNLKQPYKTLGIIWSIIDIIGVISQSGVK